MNKTVTVNLGGTIFNIEEDAFLLLKSYLDRIKLNFTTDPGQNEILSDIEVRIAELFTERLDEKRNVVIRSHVEEIIGIMGQPEEFSSDGGTSAGETERLRHDKRRIYRDKDDGMLGGVCAGMSHRLGWDPLVLRTLFVAFGILSAGTAVVAYVIFWALIPAALTTAEKLQMRGESVTVENIRRFVTDEARVVNDDRTRSGRRANEAAMRSAGQVLSKVIGLFLLLSGFGLLISIVSLSIFAEFSVFGNGDLTVDQINHLIFGDTGSYWMILTGLILVLGIPAIALLYGGTKLLLGSNRRIRGLGWSLAALFFAGLALSLIGGMRIGREFSSDAELKENIHTDLKVGDTLFVNVEADDRFTGRSEDDRDQFFELIRLEGDSIYYGEPVSLHFEESEDSSFHIRVIRESRGAGQLKAGNLASNIHFEHRLDGNVLSMEPYFSTPTSDLFRGQEVEIEIYVPQGGYVHFGQNAGLIYWNNQRAGHTYRMWDDDWE